VSVPFEPGSIVLGLHAPSGLDPIRQVEVMIAQGIAAEAAGFDGVTVSEHHAGFPGYLPQPLLMASWILGETHALWAGPGPLLLGPRNPALVAEELAWTSVRFPGRFGAVLAPGYAVSDFAALGVPEERMRAFPGLVTQVLAALSADGSLAADAAVAAWAAAPPPLLVAANGRKAVQRAAVAGLGIMFGGGHGPHQLGETAEHYRECGGSGPVLGLRPMWLGRIPETEQSREAARAYAAIGAATKGGAPSSGSPEQVVEEVAQWVRQAKVDCLNVRLHVPGVEPAVVADQIARVGAEVLPALRRRFPPIRATPVSAPRDGGSGA
jgi:alkanesulfonate monooxygenase SsuD/methylene tetrahydromethanopterin reductase-like flavin-dependent oxidoreductase (luciferase family)